MRDDLKVCVCTKIITEETLPSLSSSLVWKVDVVVVGCSSRTTLDEYSCRTVDVILKMKRDKEKQEKFIANCLLDILILSLGECATS